MPAQPLAPSPWCQRRSSRSSTSLLAPAVERAGRRIGPVVDGGVLMQAGGRDVGQDLAVPTLAGPATASWPVTLPTTVARTSHRPHTSSTELRASGVTMASMRSWLSLVITSKGARPGLAERHGFDVHVHTHPAARGRFAGGAREAGAAEVLDTEDQVLVEQLEGGLDEALFLERVADLDIGAFGCLRFGIVGEGGRSQHAHAADAVSPRGRAEQDGQVALATRSPEHEAVLRQEPATQNVDERVARITAGEFEFPADGRDPDRVAVTGNAAHDAARHPPVAGVAGRAEAERVHEGDRPGAHGEDVADYAADAGGRPLVGLDRRRVVVALYADGYGDAVAGVDHAGVLTRPDQHAPALRWAGGQGGPETTCTNSARSTSPRTWPARGGWAGDRGCRSIDSASSSVRPSSRCNEPFMTSTLGGLADVRRRLPVAHGARCAVPCAVAVPRARRRARGPSFAGVPWAN